MLELNSSEKKALRGLAQTIKPSVHVGTNGINPNIIEESDRLLKKNELIKIRFSADRNTIAQQCMEIAEKTNSCYVGGVGKTASFYRPKPQNHE